MPDPETHTPHDFRNWMATFAGLLINTGFATDGDPITIEAGADRIEQEIGPDGEVASWVNMEGELVEVTIRVRQTAAINAQLSALWETARASTNGSDVGPLTIENVLTGQRYFIANARLAKAPDITIGTKPSTNEWKLKGKLTERRD